jgi:hypothetical protein
MQLGFSKEITKDEFLSLLSSFLEKWVNHASAKLIIKEMKMSLVVDGKEYDINQGGKEAIFNLCNQSDENVILPIFEEKQLKNEVLPINPQSMSKWMFIKEKNFNIPLEIKKELEYIGETKPYYSDVMQPVYSIESYCRTRGIPFLKDDNYKYVQKSIATELIPHDTVRKIETSAIYCSRQGLSECITLNDLEALFGEPIVLEERKNRFNKSDRLRYVTKDIISKMLPYLQKIKTYGKQYKYFDHSINNNHFMDVYDLDQILGDNELLIISCEEFIEKRYIEYLSDYDLSCFPKEMNIKEKAVVYGGILDDTRYSIIIKPFYKTEQILSGYRNFIPVENLKKEQLRCPIRALPTLRSIIKKEKDIEYNNLAPIGLTAQYDLVFEKIPVQIKETLDQYILLKKKEEEVHKIKREIEI